MTGEKLMRPNMLQTARHWQEYWEGTNTAPIVWITAFRDEKKEEAGKYLLPYPQRPGEDYKTYARNIIKLYEQCMAFIGDEVPAVSFSFGPDQISGFFGQKIGYSDDSRSTSWSVRFEEELEDLLPLIKFNPDNNMYREMLRFHREAAEIFDGRVIIASLDYHSNWDAVCSLRDPMYACMDMMTKPDAVKQALSQAAEAYKRFYDEFYKAGNMASTGTSCWLSAFCPEKYVTSCCDFVTLLGPEQAEEFVFPYIEKETEDLDYHIYHLDGYTETRLLPYILKMPKLRAVNFVPGAGAPADNSLHWLKVYEQILGEGIGVQMFCTPNDALEIHRTLRSPNMFYTIYPGTESEMRKFYDEFMSI